MTNDEKIAETVFKMLRAGGFTFDAAPDNEPDVGFVINHENEEVLRAILGRKTLPKLVSQHRIDIAACIVLDIMDGEH